MLDDGNVIFRERQNIGSFMRWFIFADSVFVFAFFLFMLKFVVKEPDSMPGFALAIMFIMPIVVALLFFLARLETEVRFDGLYFRFFPLNIKYQKIEFADISQCELREFSPIRDYGGWGIRYSLRHGKAYIIAGKKGLSLTLKNGKKILISSKRPEELLKAVKTLTGQ
jgi:hypothetical protein